MADAVTRNEDPCAGEPRYRVARLTRRRILARYGVFCGTGTLPVFVTYRFLRALLVRQLLETAFADGHFVAEQHKGGW